MPGQSPETNSTQVARWVELYSREMLSWALYRTSSREIAEDLVQETFLVACQRFEKFEGSSEPKTWLFAILKNKIADHYRAVFRKNTSTLPSPEFFDEEDTWKADQRPRQWGDVQETELLDDPNFTTTLDNCMDKLPPQWRSSLHLKFIDGTNSAAICQELGITTTNYWQMLHRAKLQLRKCLEINWFKK